MSSENEEEFFSGLEVPALTEGAVQLHEFFVSMLSAGFSDTQALFLTGELLKNITNE